MKRSDNRKNILLALSASMFLVVYCSSAALSVNKHLLQGIQDYRDGDFTTAAGNLGAAMSTEFNNPMLHYYMGNCCVHLKQMETAVREFRIAYALDPAGQVGKFAKQALDYLDVDAQGQGLTKKASPQHVEPRMDPAMERALAALDKQSGTNPKYRPRQENTSQLPWWMQQKKNDVPPELSRYLDSLRQQYEGNQPGANQRFIRQPTEMQKSAENLKNLLQEKTKEGKHHLSPHGTNLYTRNYSQPTSEHKPVDPPPKPGAVPGKDNSLFEWK
jgi:hypothetical protein